MSEPSSFREVIDLWPQIADLARDLDEPYETVNQWKKRDSVPAWAHSRVVRAAHTRGFKQITHELLDDLAASRREKQGAA